MLLFLAGLVISTDTLLQPALLYGLSTLLQLSGVIIFIVRLAPKFVRVNWFAHNSSRFFAISAIFIVINIALSVFLTVSIINGNVSADNVPLGPSLALDYSIFLGVMTNAIFGLINDAAQELYPSWPWGEDILFWGMNIGVVGLLIALLSNIIVMQMIFMPIVDFSILIGLLTYARRMRSPVFGVLLRIFTKAWGKSLK
jgi:hypothetical protein